jgi:hypothetical protein
MLSELGFFIKSSLFSFVLSIELNVDVGELVNDRIVPSLQGDELRDDTGEGSKNVSKASTLLVAGSLAQGSNGFSMWICLGKDDFMLFTSDSGG